MVMVKGSLCGVSIVASGILIGILAAASIPLLNWIIHKEVTKKVLIANNSDSELYPIWEDPSLLPDFYLQVYPFHLKNPDDVANGAKPVLEQRGPYTYREYRRKEDIVFNDNGTVSYKERRWFHFQRNMSKGWDNETFTTVNIPLVALANVLHYDFGILQKIVSYIISRFKDEKLFITKTVREMVFGYPDIMLQYAHRFYPSRFYTDMVGVFAGKNYTCDGIYTVFTGQTNISKLGVIDKFKGSRYINFWSTPWANMINGSADGSVAPPFLDKNYHVSMFSMDICRSVYAHYYGDTYSKDYHIKLHRYRAPKEVLEKPSLNPDNAGFCTPLGQCMGTGVLNISSCQKVDGFYIPIMISFPHFYLAEDQYVHGVVGMKPTEDLATEIDLEPTTGLIMEAVKKIQMNLYLQNSSSFPQLKKVTNVVFPILWINESLNIDKKHAAMVKHELIIPMMAAQIIQYASIGIAVILFISGCFITANSGIKPKQQTDENIQPSSSSVHSMQNGGLPIPNDDTSEDTSSEPSAVLVESDNIEPTIPCTADDCNLNTEVESDNIEPTFPCTADDCNVNTEVDDVCDTDDKPLLSQK